jgi:hypothetical protein|tara:strand:+ start:3583 stop:3795 length:213 start_codon:yes stop_codon:yes gene_type:complete
MAKALEMSPTMGLKYAVNAMLTNAAPNAKTARIRSTFMKDMTLTTSGNIIDVTAPPVYMRIHPHRGEDME